MSSAVSRAQPPALSWRLGVEVELLAPPGRSRKDLATAIANHYGANVRRFFHPQGEPSKAPDTPFFENLTLGFAVEDEEGNLLAQCVDDLTLQDDLNQKHPPQPGWYRVVSDDSRFLRLTMLHTDANEPLQTVLRPIAELFGTFVDEGGGGMVRVADEANTPIVLGAPLPGERERPCELITPPIDRNHYERLEALLGLVRSLEFSIPAEGAIHLHYDSTELRNASTIGNLVHFFDKHGDTLKERMGTNPSCRRLGAWPQALFEVVNAPDFAGLEWEEALERLKSVKLTKYCDFNLRNMVHSIAGKNTFEVRILPVWLDAAKIIDAAALFEAILRWASEETGKLKPVPADLRDFL